MKLVITLILICLSSCSDNNNKQYAQPAKHSAAAGIHCKFYVEDQLRSPSTAKFQSFGGITVDLGNNKYLHKSYVDAQNGFGATIRTEFICEMKYLGGLDYERSNWVLVDLVIKP